MSAGQTKDGRWYCAWRGQDACSGHGQVKREYFGRGPEAETKARLRDLEIKKGKIEHAGDPQCYGDAPTFRLVAQEYINARQVELSNQTIDEILRTVSRYALPVIGNVPVNRITMADWSRIEKVLIARHVTARTINKYFQYLSKVFTWAVKRQILREHPWRLRDPLRMKNKFRIELITPDEIQRILDVADDHLRWAIEVEYNTGVRPGPTELFKLKWDDFDYETGALTVYSSKTGSSYTQYVSPHFLGRLKERRDFMRAESLRLAKRRNAILPESPYVISYQGKPVSSQLTKAWDAAKQKAGITRRIRLYDLRHFYITYALASGADILDLAHRVGHKDANMIVNVYAHLVDEMRRKEAFNLPTIQFKAIGMPTLLTKFVDQTGNSPKGAIHNNLISLFFNGRGGRI